jgi:hypothetical protein
MSGQVADRPRDAEPSQTLQAAVSISDEVTLHGGAAQTNDLGRLRACQPAVQEPEHEHLATDMLLGMGVTFGVDNLLLLFAQLNPKPRHRESLRSTTRQSLLLGSIPSARNRKCLIQPRAEYMLMGDAFPDKVGIHLVP